MTVREIKGRVRGHKKTDQSTIDNLPPLSDFSAGRQKIQYLADLATARCTAPPRVVNLKEKMITTAGSDANSGQNV